jgi:hypothetical protein
MGSAALQDCDDSNLLLPSSIDLKARLEPHKLFCALLKSEDVHDGLITITYNDYANAVNKCAAWLEETLGKGDYANPIALAYFGLPDIRQTLVALAAAKTGHKVKLITILSFDYLH